MVFVREIAYHHYDQFWPGDSPMGYFKDLREHIAALDQAGLLVKIDEQINKDTELMPLVRWQFRGLPEEERRAFMFTNVVDAKGRKYDIPVVVGTLAASRQIYGFGLQCKPEEIVDRWNKAQSNPIVPRIVENAPVHEVVYTGASLVEKGGLGEFPVPISTPGYDCVSLVHKRSGDRHHQHRQLSWPCQKPDSNRCVFELEQSRRLSLAQMSGARRPAESRAGHRRAALRRLHRAVAHSI
jgi:hypothetical protein